MFSSLECRVPPPLVAMLLALAMWAADLMWPAGVYGAALPGVIGVALLLAGIVISSLGWLAFRRAQTTVDPIRPEQATTLVTGGVYGLTRNPMYLGLVLALIGWAYYLANIAGWAGPVALLLYLQRFQIVPEERAMAQLFGTDYEAYTSKVRRWL